MTKNAKTPDKANGKADDEERELDPFDAWLGAELNAFYARDRAEPLPEDLSDLARRLERKLAASRKTTTGGSGD